MKASLAALSFFTCFTAAAAPNLKDYSQLSQEDQAAFKKCVVDYSSRAGSSKSEGNEQAKNSPSKLDTRKGVKTCIHQMSIDPKTVRGLSLVH